MSDWSGDFSGDFGSGSGRPRRRSLFTRRDWMQDPAVILSGGAWSAAAPLENIIDIRPQFVAQAVTSNSTDTKFVVDLGAVRPIGAFHFQRLYTTELGTIRVRASPFSTLSPTVFDTGVVTSWPKDNAAMSTNQWLEFTATGVYPADEYVDLGMPRFFVTDEIVNARYIAVDIVDAAAPSPVQIGCFCACEIWEPPYNIDFGWGISVIDGADITRTPYGSFYPIERGKVRRLNIGIGTIPDAEMWRRALGVMLTRGKSKPMAVLPLPHDTANLERQSVYGAVISDAQFTNPYFATHSLAFQIDQII